MLLHFRNTYKTKKIMLVYAIIAILSSLIATITLLFTSIFNYWWMYLIIVLFTMSFFYSFFLLVLQNNNYDIRYYYSKKKFKLLCNDLISKYNLEDIKTIKKIKKVSKDYFYQYGVINEKSSDIKDLVFNDWMIKQAHTSSNLNSLNYFLSRLMVVCSDYNEYKLYLVKLVNATSKDEIINELDKLGFIDRSFKDKCIFIYDYNSFVNEKFLNEIYLELRYIIEVIIGLLTKDEFKDLMYNKDYYYSKDKRSVYLIRKEDDTYSVYEKDIEYDCQDLLRDDFKNEKDAISFIKEELNKQNDA